MGLILNVGSLKEFAERGQAAKQAVDTLREELEEMGEQIEPHYPDESGEPYSDLCEPDSLDDV